MNYTHWKDAQEKKNPHGVDVRQLYDKDSAQAMHISLEPDEKLMPHKTPVDVFFYVLEGNPTIIIGEEQEKHEKGTLIESPAYITHYLANETNQKARILVVKAPRQTEKTQLL